MKVIVVGLGVQGKKRAEVAQKECVATVDPYKPDAHYRRVEDVPPYLYDAALVCTPDASKVEIITYLLNLKKHVLVEKPLLAPSSLTLEELKALAEKNEVACYTAYNHRFEPHFLRMKELIDSEKLGALYRCRLFYGNGTARDVRNSVWRDTEAGVLPDLGSHLLDTILFWFGDAISEFQLVRAYNFENKSPDHVVLATEGKPFIELEMSLLSWRNHFTCDLIGERGSAHVESLCKWGPSTFILRARKLPSGRPVEESITLVQQDPTWEAEYMYFKEMCRKGASNIVNDIFLNTTLQNLSALALVKK